MLRGSILVLVLYDVAEQVQLDKLRRILGAEPPRREPSFRHPAPDYVRFERPPVVEYPAAVSLVEGEPYRTRIKYFDYGVISVELERDFEGDWDELIQLSSRSIAAPEIERCASELMRTHLERVRPALVQPYESWLSEDYYVIHLKEALDDDGQPVAAGTILSARGEQIAQIVRGEPRPLAEGERNEALQSSMSYYPSDLLVVGWVAAVIYDNGPRRGSDHSIAGICQRSAPGIPALRRSPDASAGERVPDAPGKRRLAAALESRAPGGAPECHAARDHRTHRADRYGYQVSE